MDYVQQFRYQLFLINKMEEDMINEAYITECALITEGCRTVETMKIVNESFFSKFKEFLAKIVNKIGTIWKKFVESCDRAFNKTSKYLSNYKDIILRKKFDPDATITMYDYQTGLQKMKSAKVERFDYNRMKESLESEEKFQATLKWTNFADNTDKNKFEDKLKALFRGGEKQKTYKGSDINMSNIYDYCINYTNLKKDLQADVNNISEAAKEALKLIEEAESDTKTESVLFDNTNNSFYSFITETISTINGSDTIKNTEKTPSGENRSNVDNSFSGANKNISDEDDDAAKERESSNKTNIQSDAKAKEGESNADTQKRVKDIQDRIKVYESVCGKVLSVKQTICEEVFSEYMSIIKYHVRFNLGKEKDSDSNKTQDSYTNYSYKDVDKALNAGSTNSAHNNTEADGEDSAD